jgi:hypothetical protein
MKRWALIKNGVVDTVVIQAAQPQVFGTWVECPDSVGPGWLYSGGTFSPPLAAEPIITRLAFRYRMTDEEYVGILTAAKTDVSVAAWVETFNIVSQVNLNDSRTKSGLDMMVSKGLLTSQRETEILTAPVQPNEKI